MESKRDSTDRNLKTDGDFETPDLIRCPSFLSSLFSSWCGNTTQNLRRERWHVCLPSPSVSWYVCLALTFLTHWNCKSQQQHRNRKEILKKYSWKIDFNCQLQTFLSLSVLPMCSVLPFLSGRLLCKEFSLSSWSTIAKWKKAKVTNC